MNATNTPLAVVQEFNDLMEHMRVFMDRAGQVSEK
ncbi:hypothetical protein AG0111_0g4865 [Alternaria gaisen]|uniref:Uncharacterized protein n=1 Tax=Alternaria gaisen TaxID=167740 RepID=A0ACB6FQC5_9PLEO|nr:hypothetical protein AG0111_0g4865 [Alternaria gaisen]